ncbi:exonuclease domain-containing protein [Corynebacterium sp. LK2510]|uniref:exonuclease domain-containing protein n=1 Tax=Corynebacterium sp. LK2510 TaxID=3110472 RepID=UPI0034CF007C
MISAHGATVTVSNTALVIQPSPLSEALTGGDGRTDAGDGTDGSTSAVSIPIEAITEVTVTRHADAWDIGAVEIGTSTMARGVTLRFSPNSERAQEEFLALVDAARRGEAPETSAVSPDQALGTDPAEALRGFSFVGFDVETANQRWGSICQIGLVKIIDGVEVDRASWLCTPPKSLGEFDPYNVGIHGISAEDVAGQPSVAERVDQLTEFVGDLPLVAHNAQFDASALRDACVATNHDVPALLFACTLAQARAARLKVDNHRLPTLAAHYGVALDNHHDACADAAACAGIMLGLARDAHHSGDLMSYVHGTGFVLGSIAPERVTPVLRDRSGAARALQAEAARSSDPAAAVAAATAPRGSNQHGPDAGAPGGEAGLAGSAAPESSGGSRRPAPWQSVATPDTVPEPNPTADPASPLYGQHVTLTGEFGPFDKGLLWNGIAEQGATVGKNVTKKTTILVAGEWATMTSKEKRARELKDKGQEIEIWDSSQLFDALGLDPASA